MVAAIERAVDSRWDTALARAAETNSSPAGPRTRDERVALVRSRFRRELVALGAATGGSAAVPGVGTAAAIGMTATEIGWTATRATDMILTLAAIDGHIDATLEQRKAWTLALFAFDGSGPDAAAASYNQLARELDASGVGSRGPLPPALLQTLNRALARRVIARYGAKKGAAMLTRLLPFGVGALVGAASNFRMVDTVIDRADGFFNELAYWRRMPPPTGESTTSPERTDLSPALPRDPRSVLDID